MVTLLCVTCQSRNVNFEETLRQGTEDMKKEDNSLPGMFHSVLVKGLIVITNTESFDKIVINRIPGGYECKVGLLIPQVVAR